MAIDGRQQHPQTTWQAMRWKDGRSANRESRPAAAPNRIIASTVEAILKPSVQSRQGYVRDPPLAREELATDTLRAMRADPEPKLADALERFLHDAKQFVDEDREHRRAQLSAQAVTESLAALPACHQAAAAVRRAAAANGYEVAGVSSQGSAEQVPENAGPSGRPLDAGTLVSTGIVALLLDSAAIDPKAVAGDLASYLAGPPIGIWDYAILDANVTTDEPIPVADGWELVPPSVEQLRELLPIPATGAYQPDRPFAPEEYGRLAMLRRVNSKARPHYGHLLRWDVLYSLALKRPAHLLWQPLLVLSLFNNPVIQLWARYQLEPGRRIDKLFDAVDWKVYTPDGETEIDEPATGEFGSDIDTPTLRRFLAELAPLLMAVPPGLDLLIVGGGVVEPVSGGWLLAAGSAGEDQPSLASVGESPVQHSLGFRDHRRPFFHQMCSRTVEGH